jgi:hypothetical protein
MDDVPHISLLDAATGEEIEGIAVFSLAIPRAGERIHWWQDGFPDAAGTDSGLRRDFEVIRVEHDWRYMPAGRAKTVCSVLLHVREIDKENDDAG